MSPNWGAAVKALTRGAGADDAVLVAGGDSVNQSLEELKIGGNLVITGLLQDPNFTVKKMNRAKIARMISQRNVQHPLMQ